MDDPRYFSKTTGGYRGKVIGDRKWHIYMGHYDKATYQREMEDYRKGMRKSKPNGRKWCMLRLDKDYEIVNELSNSFEIRLINGNTKSKTFADSNNEMTEDARLKLLIYCARYRKDYRFISAILRKIL